ncbi:STM3941 family protein [Hoeflea prorocentri]|uniref:Uncharacterized protein n=1 Tax=Hoeflea prorocentri TaxID=1922333 RepID=A0A9X3UH09_9HYPH|nr:STM3941 family protein [Hoeflea prorocentri]MCY6380527.1 hypothetical protein [Hoeflea prorocentri]MDA5398327.1 hypothetical protein [Hoeflea prorocentri]
MARNVSKLQGQSLSPSKTLNSPAGTNDPAIENKVFPAFRGKAIAILCFFTIGVCMMLGILSHEYGWDLLFFQGLTGGTSTIMYRPAVVVSHVGLPFFALLSIYFLKRSIFLTNVLVLSSRGIEYEGYAVGKPVTINWSEFASCEIYTNSYKHRLIGIRVKDLDGLKNRLTKSDVLARYMHFDCWKNGYGFSISNGLIDQKTDEIKRQIDEYAEYYRALASASASTIS